MLKNELHGFRQMINYTVDISYVYLTIEKTFIFN